MRIPLRPIGLESCLRARVDGGLDSIPAPPHLHPLIHPDAPPCRSTSMIHRLALLTALLLTTILPPRTAAQADTAGLRRSIEQITRGYKAWWG